MFGSVTVSIINSSAREGTGWNGGYVKSIIINMIFQSIVPGEELLTNKYNANGKYKSASVLGAKYILSLKKTILTTRTNMIAPVIDTL